MEKFILPRRFKNAHLSVWNEFAELDMKYNPVNLGTGKPDFMPPAQITSQLTEVSGTPNASLQQQPEPKGLIRLRKALSRLYQTDLNRVIDAYKEVIVTCGAYESLYDAVTGFIGENDEVILIEPFFDCYEPLTLVAGGKVRFIPLRITGPGLSSADWKLDEDELRASFNEKTKMIVLNTPMNPVGKVFSLEELKLIAELCTEYDVICLADEVYEWLTYAPAKHIKIAALPGMWQRTITVGSAGKTLWVTGWKCGWAIAPQFFIDRMQRVQELNTLHYITPIQEAIAKFLEIEVERLGSPESYLKQSNEIARKKRDEFIGILRKSGFDPIIPEGGFFILADWSKLGNQLDLSSEITGEKDFRFAKWMVKNIGVSSIPPTAFYSDKNKRMGENLIRFCFLKADKTLEEATKSFEKLPTYRITAIAAKVPEV